MTGWRVGALLCAGLMAGCVPLAGGWDVEGLLEAEPELTSIPDQRFGDMTPFPALVDGRLMLVACRYAGGNQSVLVLSSATGPQREWTSLVIDAVDQAIPGVELEVSLVLASDSNSDRRIEIRPIADFDAEVPKGMGDTLSECDVSRKPDSDSSVTGGLTRSVIRLREVVRDREGQIRSTTDVEWVAALLHELGHALGFSGHAAVGDSLVVLDENRLRRFAKKVLAKEPIPAPNLTALYSVEPGVVLGEAVVMPEGRRAIDAVERLVADRDQRLQRVAGPLASAGDQAARIVWRWAGGIEAELRFPSWRHEIRKGDPITVLPDIMTSESDGP
jgi:hypothetical protein